MGIDLEQPSGEYSREDNQVGQDAIVVNSVDGEFDRDADILSSHNIAGNVEENIGPVVGGRVADSANREYVGAEIDANSFKNSEPHNAMEFESKEDAFSFYKDYAMTLGFSTIIKASRRSRISGKFIDAKFVCTRYGTKKETSTTEMPLPTFSADAAEIPVKSKRGRKSRSWSKTDCKACMHVKRRQQDGKWVVHSFVKEHNHEILPDEAYYSRGIRNSDLGNNNGDALQAIRARTRNMCIDMSRRSGGYRKQGNQKGKVSHESGKAQCLALEEEDTQALLEHFVDMQGENPNFFYAIDLNKEKILRNVFWVDGKSRLDYGSFSDVVLFDTTFIKSECKLPFALFIGVNHHFQFLLLGCSLLANETKLTYTWVMNAWLRAMQGNAPRVILTDQEQVLKEAIAEIFPSSCHCFCLWHVLSKVPEKLGYVMRQREGFMAKFSKCVLKSGTNEQLEKRWWKLVTRFNLGNDVWFQSLYEDRQRWMPIYIREIVLAGMSTLQWSECISSFFDKLVQRKTTVKEFLVKQKLLLIEKFEEEAKADFENWHKQPVLKSPSPFGKQMAALYTHAIFKKFQVEVLGVVACHPRKESEDGETTMFKVQDYEENQDFSVIRNEKTSELSCSCRLFEFNGFLCRHVLIVLQMSGEHSIPSRYILKRWTKDAKNRQTVRQQSDETKCRVQRYNDLCQQAFKLGDEGSLSQESYSMAFNALEEALRKCERLNNSLQSAIELTSSPSRGGNGHEEENQADGASKSNENNVIQKGRHVNPEPKVTTIGMHDGWQQMVTSVEQLNSRAPTLDGYFGPHQTAQASTSFLGQLNLIPSSQDDYYFNQHGVQGLGQLNSIAPIPDYMAQQRMQGMDQSDAGSSPIHTPSNHLHLKNLPC